jgi:hypothetical protein
MAKVLSRKALASIRPPAKMPKRTHFESDRLSALPVPSLVPGITPPLFQFSTVKISAFPLSHLVTPSPFTIAACRVAFALPPIA